MGGKGEKGRGGPSIRLGRAGGEVHKDVAQWNGAQLGTLRKRHRNACPKRPNPLCPATASRYFHHPLSTQDFSYGTAAAPLRSRPRTDHLILLVWPEQWARSTEAGPLHFDVREWRTREGCNNHKGLRA